MHKSDIQAILFDKTYFTESKAIKWLEKHHKIPSKEVHKTTNFLRYRIMDPKQFDHFTTIKLSNHIDLIIGFYKQKKGSIKKKTSKHKQKK